MTPVALHAGNPGTMTGTGNWTWFIAAKSPVLIDAGVGKTSHLDAITSAAGDSTLRVFVTHGHPDHASGASAIAARLPDTRFHKMPWAEVDSAQSIRWRPIADGEIVAADDTSLVALHTPGHAPDHVCFWDPVSRSLFGGDLVIAGTTVWIPSRSGDVAAYIGSLERILALQPARIYPAHGPIIDNPGPVLEAYIAHRREREAQILDHLRRGPATADALVTMIYAGLPDALLARATDTVLAHLLKLQRDRTVSRDGDAWHMIRP